MLALAQEHFWWPRMDEDCQALVTGCQRCTIFEGTVVKALLCLIQAYMPLELVHVDFTSRDNHGAESATQHQKCLGSSQITSQDM